MPLTTTQALGWKNGRDPVKKAVLLILGSTIAPNVTAGSEDSQRNEWRKLFTSIICPFTAQELEELVYGIAALADRELKDPNPKKVASIFDIPTHSHDARGYREEPRYKKMSLAEALEWHNSRLDYRRVLYKKSILRPIQPQEHTFIDPYYKQHGRTNPDYLRYNLAHRFGTRGKNQIALDYYKFPCFYTYGRPFEKLDFRSLLLYVAQPEEDSTGHIFSGPFIEELSIESTG